MTKVKARVVERYNDLNLGEIQEVDTVLEVTEERAKKLVEHKKAVILEENQKAKKISEKID